MNLKFAAEAVNTAADILKEDNDKADRAGARVGVNRKPCQYHNGLTCYCNGKDLCLDAA